MKIGLRIHWMLIGAALLFMPIIGSLDISMFGGLGRHGSFYPLFCGLLLLFIGFATKKTELYIPRTKSFFAILAFCAVIVLSGLINISDLSYMHYQGVNGVMRFFIQCGTLLYSLCIAIYIYTICKKVDNKSPLAFVEKCLIGSFFLAGAYSILEIGAIWEGEAFKEALFAVDSIFRPANENRDIYTRLHSLAIEAPTFAMYMGVVFPWVLSLCHICKGIRMLGSVLLSVYLVLLIILSFSRTAYIVTGMEIILYALLFRREGLKKRYICIVFIPAVFYYILLNNDTGFLSVDLLQVFSSIFMSEGYYSASNTVRYGTVMAGLGIWNDNPILGVGYGGYGFYSFDYFPASIWLAPDPFIWADNSLVNGTWPPIHNLYVRLLAEAGAIGLIAWISVNIFVLKEEKAILSSRLEGNDNARVKNLIISTAACIMYGFNGDIIYFHFFWISVGIRWFYLDKIRMGRSYEKNSTICAR